MWEEFCSVCFIDQIFFFLLISVSFLYDGKPRRRHHPRGTRRGRPRGSRRGGGSGTMGRTKGTSNNSGILFQFVF